MSKKIEATPGFFLMLALLLYLDGGLIFWAAVSAALLHELAHYAAARAFGASLRRLRLTAAGAEMALARHTPLPYPAELTIAAAGPLTNLLLALVLANLLALSNRFLLAGVHLSLGVFNLLPVDPLDGGQILRTLISALWSPTQGQTITAALSLTLSAALALLGILTLLRGSNPSLLVTALWLIARNFPQKNRPRFQ